MAVAKMLPWVRLPSKWIGEKGLRNFVWGQGEGPNNTAALMVLAALSHHTDGSGVASFTYDHACTATGLSRSKVAAALKLLVKRALIERGPTRSVFRLSRYDTSGGWAKFPAARLYRADGAIASFQHIHLRRREELDALKLYFLFAERADSKLGAALISYPTIEEYSGVPRNNIRAALSWLAAHAMVHIDHVPSQAGDYVVNAYRLVHLDSRQHMGTSWQQLLEPRPRAPSPLPTTDG